MLVTVTIFYLMFTICSRSAKAFSNSNLRPSLLSKKLLMYEASQELVQIVDETNQPMFSCKRSKMRTENLRHRATYAFIKNSNNLFYVQKRSALKDYCPLHFDATPGGVVAANESYAEANIREINEEMGIPVNTPTQHLFTFYFEDENVKCFGDVWEMTYDGELKLQKEEVESVHLMSMSEIFDRYNRGEKFAPDSIYACKEYVKFKESSR